ETKHLGYAAHPPTAPPRSEGSDPLSTVAPHDLSGRLILPLALVRDRPQKAAFCPCQVTSTTRSGRTQCTRDSSSGEPNLFSRGGGSASGMRGVSRGLSTPARRPNSFSVKPVPARPA